MSVPANEPVLRADVPVSVPDLRPHGLANLGDVYAHLPSARLVELAVARREGMLTDNGALVAYTGERTGRSPKDKYLVREPATADEIDWSATNQALEPAVYDRLFAKVQAYLQQRDVFVTDGIACAEPAHALRVRVIAEKAWHALFARCLFRRPPFSELVRFQPDWTVYAVPELSADPARDGTKGTVFVVLNPAARTVLIGGTHYAGEIKKSIFTVLNLLLPLRGVFPMHCSANVGTAGDVALFFGLSGTGKTTLSADPERRLIGDDEHGWSDTGVFNIEGGCYAKTIRLSAIGEPQIWDAIRFGSVLENVPVDPRTRQADFASDRFTENTRAAYPVDFIPNAEPTGRGGHPRNVVFLTCDAFGVLPPIARLTADQALYHFLSGNTAKVAGTEAGVTQPEPNFSTCFGAPFLPLRPTRYAELLRERLTKHRVPVWLLNTGWTGGAPGVGKRMSLTHTRSLLRAVLQGQLLDVPCVRDPVFGLDVPTACPEVPSAVLQPRQVWADPTAYARSARELAARFRKNFARHAATAGPEVIAAGPPESLGMEPG